MFDKTSAVVCPNSCNCSLKQLQLLDQSTAVIHEHVFMKKLQLFGATTADCRQHSCSYSPKQLRFVGQPTAIA
jgi:hypothetical protein